MFFNNTDARIQDILLFLKKDDSCLFIPAFPVNRGLLFLTIILL